MSTLSDKTKSGDFDAPNTKDDMDDLETWEYGDEIKGTFAKSHKGFERYRRDIEKAYGNEDDYDSNVVYINTFSTDSIDRTINKQLKKFK
jgi:hypothetical protein